ncbi:MAG: hypothetical protein A2V77_07355 [Anaeromyxobacter sp. RBG_16_69_14]|nr:MAG: hypothetical protein A2V77_07355 [Anaeromyxobacter sp. RBG_16_69_14]
MLAGGGVGRPRGMSQVHADAQDTARDPVNDERRAVRLRPRHQANVHGWPARAVGEEDEITPGGTARGCEGTSSIGERVHGLGVAYLGRKRMARARERSPHQRSATRAVVDPVEDDGAPADERGGRLDRLHHFGVRRATGRRAGALFGSAGPALAGGRGHGVAARPR